MILTLNFLPQRGKFLAPQAIFFLAFCRKLAIYATKHNYFTTFQVILRHFTSQDLSVIINLQLFIHFCHFFYPLTKNLNLISLPHGQWGKLYYIFLVNYVEFSSLKQPGNIIISPLGNEGQEISFELPSRE